MHMWCLIGFLFVFRVELPLYLYIISTLFRGGRKLNWGEVSMEVEV